MKRPKPKARKWLIHYYRIGGNARNFAESWPIDADGVGAVEAFRTFESTGKKVATRHPDGIGRLTAGKAVHGINVMMYAQDRLDGMLAKAELKEICNEVPGMFEEVEMLKWKLYDARRVA